MKISKDIKIFTLLMLKLALIMITIAVLVFVVETKQDYKDWSRCYDNSIENPMNEAFVLECAFNLGVDTSEVTQWQFYQRYHP